MEYTEDSERSVAKRTEHYYFTKAEWRKVLETIIGKSIPSDARVDQYHAVSPAMMRYTAKIQAGKAAIKPLDSEGGFAITVVTEIL